LLVDQNSRRSSLSLPRSGVVVDHVAADAAVLGQGARLRHNGLRGQHAADRREERVAVQEFQGTLSCSTASIVARRLIRRPSA